MVYQKILNAHPEHEWNCDYYHLLMAQGFFDSGMQNQKVCFEFFFRQLPFNGAYGIFAGLDSFLEMLEDCSFSPNMIQFLESKSVFHKDFLNFLSQWRFNGDIFSVQEGDLVFAQSPIMRIEGNILECHLLETMILNTLNYQSLIATKASRILCVAEGIPFVEMGLRRAYGPNGALFASRAAFIGGATATSNILAASRFNLPIIGSMSHSWVMSYPSELEAFLAFGRLYPMNQIFLIDTYNTLKSGIDNAIQAFLILEQEQIRSSHIKITRAVRIDSGDLDYLAKNVRKILDHAGLEDVQILVTDNIDENILSQMLQSKAPVDMVGIGTYLVSRFINDFSGVYKMVALWQDNQWTPRIKISESQHKTTIAGSKNVIRFYNEDNIAIMDYIFLEEEYCELIEKVKRLETIDVFFPLNPYKKKRIYNYTNFRVLLFPVLKEGRRLNVPRELKTIQREVQDNLNTLHPSHKKLLKPHRYSVGYSYKLSVMTQQALAKASSPHSS